MDWLRQVLESNRKRKELWGTIPAGSIALFMALAFCLFGAVGTLVQMTLHLDSPPHLHGRE